jgi:protoheme IX farnesyltransferase
MERHTRSYLQLIKPGITLSNSIAAAAGYFLAASVYGFNVTVLLATVGGVALIIASACVVNNMIDRNRDLRMKRTKGREVAAGNISLVNAGIYAFVLGVLGFELLVAWTNGLTVVLGVVAYVWYVVIYGIAKRTTPLSTIIGAVPGALPPVAGYTALSGHLDAIAWVLFGLMMVWQLPHFYAISIFRRSDYKSAGLPVWSVRYGTKSTKAQLFFWVVIFALLALLPTLLHVTGYVYLIVMATMSIYWVAIGTMSYRKLSDEKWAKQMFGVSLVALLVMCASLAVGGYIV